MIKKLTLVRKPFVPIDTMQADGTVYVMHSIEDTVFNLTRDDLVRVAESME